MWWLQSAFKTTNEDCPTRWDEAAQHAHAGPQEFEKRTTNKMELGKCYEVRQCQAQVSAEHSRHTRTVGCKRQKVYAIRTAKDLLEEELKTAHTRANVKVRAATSVEEVD